MPGVEVDGAKTWCARHLAILQLDPNRVFALASQRLFDYVVRMPVVQIECGLDPITGTKADVGKLTDVIASHQPLCCFVSSEVLGHVYREAYWGKYERAQAEMLRTEQIAGGLRGSDASRPIRTH